MINRYVWIILVLTVCSLAGCGVLSDEQALREFKAAYPNAEVYEQFVGEGDCDHAYMHFRYTEAGSEEKREVVWVYQRQKDSKWTVIHKSDPKPPGSDFGD
jgi:hypothetical protein